MATKPRAGLDALVQALEELIPLRCRLLHEAVQPQAIQQLFPQEQLAIRSAITARQAEFATGRSLYRRACAEWSLPESALPMREDRSPAWPADLRGAISHAAGEVVVGLLHPQDAKGYGFGLDLEVRSSLDEELWPSLFTVEEQKRLNPDRALRAFSIKEAVFKAMLPFDNRGLDFLAVEVHWTAEEQAVLQPLADARRRLDGVAPAWQCWSLADEDYALSAVLIRA